MAEFKHVHVDLDELECSLAFNLHKYKMLLNIHGYHSRSRPTRIEFKPPRRLQINKNIKYMCSQEQPHDDNKYSNLYVDEKVHDSLIIGMITSYASNEELIQAHVKRSTLKQYPCYC